MVVAGVVDVAVDSCALLLWVVYAADSYVDEYGVFFDYVWCDEVGFACCADDDVGLFGVLADVWCAGVALGDGGVGVFSGEHESDGAADGDASSDDAYVFSFEWDVVGVEEGEDASWGAW